MPATLPKQFILKRLPQNDEELWWAVRALWGLTIPRTPVCPNHSTPFQAFADAYFGRTPVTVWKASRGYGGKSYLLAALSLTEATLWSAGVSLLGGSGAQSLNIHQHTTEMWDWHHSPKQLLDGDPTKFDTRIKHGGYIRSLTASQTSVRGPHPQRLRLDEIDEMDLEILEAAQGQPMRKMRRGIMVETQTVMSSTHQYPDKTMSVILARAKEKGWPIYEWCYRESSNPIDGWLSADEVERKKAEIPQNMWDTEYELQEPNFGNRSIDPALVALSFSPALGEFSGEQPVVIEQREAGAKYVTGIDWAKERDQTIVATFKVVPREDRDTYRCVAWMKMNRTPWPIMVGRALTQWYAYEGDLVHDATGIGNVVDDLIKEQAPPHLQRRVTPYVMTGGGKRAALFSEYVAAIERQDCMYPRIEYAYDEHRYLTDDDLYSTKGHPPDSVVAGSLAWTKRKSRIRVVAPTGITTKSGWTM